jgi:hypothetical protein
MKLEDGTIVDFEYDYDRQTRVSIYILSSENKGIPRTSILVDSNGKEWNSTDVEYHTLLNPSNYSK